MIRHEGDGWTLYNADALAALKTMADASVDAVCSDPPSGIHFMGKSWDDNKGGRDAWIAWLTEVMTEVVRVMKPGAHALIWSLPRTSHWTGMALENAGLEVRDIIHHIQAAGFPKSLDVSKQLDLDAFTAWLVEHRPRMKRYTRRLWNATEKDRWAWKWCELAAERWGELVGKRQVVGSIRKTPYSTPATNDGWKRPSHNTDAPSEVRNHMDITAPATDAAKRWAGYGSSLKPSVENWLLCRKPLDGTIAQNVLRHGVGGLAIDACRVGVNQDDPNKRRATGEYGNPSRRFDGDFPINHVRPATLTGGRWPSNLLLSHAPGCQKIGSKQVKVAYSQPTRGTDDGSQVYPLGRSEIGQPVGYADADGLERVDEWSCVEGCAVAILDRQAGVRKSGKPAGKRNATNGFSRGITPGAHDLTGYGDEGSASRFFTVLSFEPEYDAPFVYVPKASRSERERGLEGMKERETVFAPMGINTDEGIRARGRNPEKQTQTTKNHHPCVKPVNLCRWLVRLICPPGGIVLDPFCGSGSVGVAALSEGMRYIGIDSDASYIDIARARLTWAVSQRPEAVQAALAI